MYARHRYPNALLTIPSHASVQPATIGESDTLPTQQLVLTLSFSRK